MSVIYFVTLSLFCNFSTKQKWITLTRTLFSGSKYSKDKRAEVRNAKSHRERIKKAKKICYNFFTYLFSVLMLDIFKKALKNGKYIYKKNKSIQTSKQS